MKFNKAEVLKIVKENRKRHEKNYKAAVKIYQKEIVAEVKKIYDNARKEKRVKCGHIYINTTEPEQHLKDYDEVIEMLEMSTGDEIELNRENYRQFIKDEWKWSSSYQSNTMGKLGL